MIFIFVCTSFVLAIGNIDNNDLKVKISPKYPKEYDGFTIKLDSYLFDLDHAITSLFVNDFLQQTGKGIKEFYVATGPVGQQQKIRIEVEYGKNEKIIKRFTINPANVFLIYEPIAPYKPYGYQGKSIALSDSLMRVYAFAKIVDKNGKLIPAEELIYRWYYNYEFIPSKSGYGKKTFLIDRLPAYPRTTNILVKVFAPDGSAIAQDSIDFKPQKTTVEFYVLDPVLPFTFKNIANPTLKSTHLDVDVMAVPYFMNHARNNLITWKVNGREAIPKSDDNQLLISLSNKIDRFREKVNLFLRVKSYKRILQSVESNTDLIFDKDSILNKNKIDDNKFFNKENNNNNENKNGLFGLF